ncbi:MAG: ZIP family metal transporter [Allosphingosinicella sp.]|uniref:ZIP family metal transporter n=1 Tax=Allosphingosinicella sp. TaxID=2823234 RepID=UPI00394C2AC0
MRGEGHLHSAGRAQLDWQLILLATFASGLAGLATAGGALLIYAVPRKRLEQIEHPALGFTAGVMLAASFFSLILPGIESATEAGMPLRSAAAIVVGALLAGGAVIFLMKRYSPPFERMLLNPADIEPDRARRIWIFIAAIILHNLPEGLAVGVSFGGGDIANGTATAIGIGLQNVPEGLAVALLVLSLGYRRSTALLVALLSGLVEPLMGFVGIAMVSMASALLPWGMGFAAGAMIYVVTADIIPETHRKGNADRANAGLMIGLAVMLFLDITLG